MLQLLFLIQKIFQPLTTSLTIKQLSTSMILIETLPLEKLLKTP
jgi:hypothetical protein